MSDLGLWIAVAAGGAAGAVVRGSIFHAMERWSPHGAGGRWAEFGAARSTLLVNILGSFLLGGVVRGFGPTVADPTDPLFAFWATGVCGAITTFSTLCADVMSLSRTRSRRYVAAALLANTLLGLAALAFGLVVMG